MIGGHLRIVVSVAALAAGLVAQPALAQSAASQTPQPSDNAAVPQAAQPVANTAAQTGATQSAPASVDDIIVTAQKRSQSLQDVPIVVTTVSHQLLQDTGVKDIKDLALLAPGLLVTSTSSEASTTARIRGIGTVGDNPGLESSVGIVIDGVYRSRNGVGFGDLGDVERIEVLKGPQGTLFGKSATAGVINIITALPQFEYHADAEFTASNYHGYGGAAEVTGPVSDTLAASLYFADRQRDGFFHVNDGAGPNTATRDTDRDFYTVRGQLLFKPNETFTARLIADYSSRNEHCCIAVIIRPSQAPGPNLANGSVAALGGNDGDPTNPYARNAYANRPDRQRTRDGGVSMQIDGQIGPGTLTSITAVRSWKQTGGFDSDFSTLDLLYLPDDNSNSTLFRTMSQELRYAGTTKNLDYLVGGFYSNENLHQNTSILTGSSFTNYLSYAISPLAGGFNPTFLQTGLTFPFVSSNGARGVNYPANSGAIDRYRQDDNTYAAFTNDTLHLTSKLDFNIGLRYTIDQKSLNSYSTNIGGGAACGAANTAISFIPNTPASEAALAAVNQTLCLPFLSPGYNNFFDHQSEAEHNLSGTAKLAYKFSRDLLVYASYARGYKAGGFNLDRVQCAVGTAGCARGTAAAVTPITDTSFGKETNNAFEIGEKATLFDRKVLFNVTGFYQRYTGFQLNTFNGFVFVVDSVPHVISKGADVDFVWFTTPKLTFQGGFTYADTRYDLTTAQLVDLKTRTGFQGQRNSRLSLAPLWSASLSGTYTQPIGDSYKARLNAGAKYNSDYNTGSDLDPGKAQKAFTLVNARLGFGPQNDRWSIEAWVENAFDTNYKQVAFNSAFQNLPSNATGVLDAFLGAPRTFGGTGRIKF
ncbi:TonB-dependent receptor [uncultured Sphingomonas sp.]|uniref:TonB-dependent receptor n=1 Tax=uncultured Sphingomonas sp. TaxID=158754 RepID=UPI0035CA82F4